MSTPAIAPPAGSPRSRGRLTAIPEPERRAAPAEHAGWLCRTEADRERLFDMSPGVRRARRLAAVLCGAGVLAMAPWLGWAPVALFLLAPGPLLLVDRWMSRVARPERIAAAVVAFNFALIVVGAAITRGEHSPILAWAAIPIVTAAARFRLRVFLTVAGLAAVVTVACLFAFSSGSVLHDPTPAIGTLVLLAALVVVEQPVLEAESRWRKDAVLDPLTGLLNRQGLEQRFSELAEQARLVGAPVSLVLFDLDKFKSINDEHGHARGDEVLVDIAYLLRKQLRSFELLYRLGGDELLLLLPGACAADALRVAEHAREAIDGGHPAGMAVTASIGVATAEGELIELAPMFEAADGLLYDAKRDGRNRVAARAA